MSERTWPSEWLRGVLELCVLKILAEGPTWGYNIAVSLETAGFGAIKGGTLYPLLGRLEESGAVSVEWRAGDGGPGRKYFTLTKAGADVLAEKTELWLGFTATTLQLVAPSSSPNREDTP